MSETEQMVKVETAHKQDNSAINPNIADPVIEVENLNLQYGDKPALHNIYLEIPKNQATAFIGPSGCGKSTL